MFERSALYVIFLFLLYNLILIDEEFIIMSTIIISFSIMLNILFNQLRTSYFDFYILIKKIYIKFINININIVKRLITSYKKQRKLRRRVLYNIYKIKNQLVRKFSFSLIELKVISKFLILNFITLVISKIIYINKNLENSINQELMVN